MSLELKNKLIVVVANEPWGDIWYSKHNYAYELSLNNTVVFINPAPAWKFSAMFKKPELMNIKGDLFVLNYSNFFPLFNTVLLKLNTSLVSKKIKKYLHAYFSKTIDVFWSFDPHRLFNPKLFSAQKSIFHVVDKYDFKFFGETVLAKESNLVVIVSPLFKNQYETINKNIIHIPHGIGLNQFKETAVPEIDYQALYVGNIDERINFKLLEKILQQFPETKFLFIGHFYSETDALAKSLFIEKKYSNLNWIGVQPFNELKNYIAKAHFCLSIMDASYPGNDIAHHKTLQYLAFGKPIFGSIFKDYSDLSGLIYQSNNNDELIKLMKDFILNHEAKELSTKRIDYALQFTYDKLILKIETALNDLQK